jgi:hypothetical protein
MLPRWLAVVALASACGKVEAPAVPDAASDLPITYQASLAATDPVTFGGPVTGHNYCFYTITLKQLSLELAITPSGSVRSGRVQALNSEATTADCDQGTIPENIATYTFVSAAPSGSGMTLTFQGAAANMPPASLAVELSTAGTAHQARLRFHRLGVDPPLDWSVVTPSLSLSPQ